MSNQTITVEGKPGSGTRRLLHLCLILTVGAAIIVGIGRQTHAPGLLLFTAKLVFLGGAVGAAFLTLGRLWVGETRSIEWAKNLALLFATLAIMTVLAEFGLRAVFSGITTTGDTSSYWGRRWKATHVHPNHLGYREREFPVQKSPGVYRIAVIGDSFTFGQGIEERERFSNRIEGALNRGGRGFEVLNFGRRGAQTVHEVWMFTDAVIGIQPDFVLLQWYVNDFQGTADTNGRPKGLPLLPSETLGPVLHQNSVLYYILEKQWESLQVQLGWIKSYDDYMRMRFGDPASPGSREAMVALAKFVALCREREIALGIVLFPDMAAIAQQEYSFAYLHERVLAFCAQEGLSCLDLREAMAQPAHRVDLKVNRFDRHPSAEANRIAAEAIMNRFGPIWDQAASGR